MSINLTHIQLPVNEIIPQVKGSLQKLNTLIVGAPPGAGKSTLLPLALLDEVWLTNKKIIMLEPRRLAAKSIAKRMADLLEEEPGKTVGYRIRFETCVSKHTKLEVVTEGILTRMLQSDNALEDVGLVIFDEFHERNLQADLALALCRESQQLLRTDLRILIMSATLDMPELSQLLQAPVIESKGRQYSVEVFYQNDADEKLLPELASQTILKALRENDGDILAFLPGEGEIRKCEELLKLHSGDVRIHPLYGMLPFQEQYHAIMPNKFGKRKVVLATSIAETSLTIEGIKIVVDCGFTRTSRFDTSTGLSRLETIHISKDAADQRAGRAGRLSEGVCYRMWTKATHERMKDHRTPEIMEADLCSLVLELLKWGTSDITQLCWLTAPPKSSVTQAMDLLQQLNAIDKNKLTDHGKQIHKLACHPRIAHMLIMAESKEMKQLACDIAAVLEERDPLPKDTGIDINLRIETLRRNRGNNTMNFQFKRIEKNAASYRQLLQLDVNNEPMDPFDTGLLLAYAYPERIASARPGNNAQFQLANGRIAMASHTDDLAHEPWISVASMDLRDGMGKIFMAAPLNPKDLIHLVKESNTVVWDSRKGGLISAKELRIGNIILQSKPLKEVTQEQITEAIAEVLKNEADSLLDWNNDEFIQLQNRILSLSLWNPEQEWPTVTKESLISNCRAWLGPYLTGVRKNEDLKKLDLVMCLKHSLNFEQQHLLDELAPAKLKVPGGSNIRIEYFANGATPVLAVRLQEVFGLADTPTMNKGKTKAVLHLLSPGYKPVQVTSDLKSFWNNMYYEVKKELQRRYPKHAWPENPWEAKAVAKGKPTK